jgi:predicted nuclease with RNAse H fold
MGAAVAWTVVGVDCATSPERTGLAYGVVDGNNLLELKRATLGTAGESAAATIAGWIAGAENYVVAFDAPLGWPAALGVTLASHRAGTPIEVEATQMFSRETDRFVRAALGKRPLEVGADRIARTARAALDLLDQVRQATGKELPLAWKSGRSSGVIEVYPAASLLSRGISASGYKGETPAARKARTAMLERLRPEFRTSVSAEVLVEDDDILDAVVCTLAAADFARGEAIAPDNRKLARREGWIWFRDRGQRKLF